jgi:hypothetical protein
LQKEKEAYLKKCNSLRVKFLKKCSTTSLDTKQSIPELVRVGTKQNILIP